MNDMGVVDLGMVDMRVVDIWMIVVEVVELVVGELEVVGLVVEVVGEDCLKVADESCSMNVHARFGTHHQ